jgi:RNA polymerase sigma factor (sigma-70 family)
MGVGGWAIAPILNPTWQVDIPGPSVNLGALQWVVRLSGGAVHDTEIEGFIATDYRRVVATVALVTGSRAAAEDAVQEALARAWEQSEKGKVIESLPAWVTTVSLNVARTGVRRFFAEQRARARLQDPDASGPDVADHTATLDVRRALAGLTRRQREVTVLRYYGGLDVADIAGGLGISEGTVKTLLFRARAALVDALRIDDDEEVTNPAGG